MGASILEGLGSYAVRMQIAGVVAVDGVVVSLLSLTDGWDLNETLTLRWE